MAYLKPKTIICPNCGFSATIKLVVGVGPMSRRGDVPSQSVQDAGPFIKETRADGRPTGALLCPHDGTVVWRNIRGARAFGPLTQRDMQSPRGRRWYAPGTAPPRPAKQPTFPKQKTPPRPIRPKASLSPIKVK